MDTASNIIGPDTGSNRIGTDTPYKGIGTFSNFIGTNTINMLIDTLSTCACRGGRAARCNRREGGNACRGDRADT